MPERNNQTENAAQLNLLYEIGRVLASAETLVEAAPQILEAICRNLDFELGELWRVRGEEKFLRLENVWHLPSAELENFVAQSRQFEFSAGDGLPGKVWAKSAPVWLENISREDSLPRKNFIEEIGMQSAVAFPILLGGKFLGAFSFFCRRSCPHDEELLKMFAAVGNHVGQFIKREQTESHLRESENRYRAFITQSTEGIWRFELDEKIPVNLPVDEQLRRAFEFGYLAECNDAMARMYGFGRAEDLIGSRISDLLDMTDAANVEYLHSFFESGYNITDSESHEKDANGNDVFFLNSLIGTVEDGNLVRVWGTQRDITEQKRAERAVLASEESYRIVAETASDAIIKIDEQSRVLFVNHSFERIFGYKVEEILGQPLTMIMPEELRERHRAGFSRYLETGVRHLSWAGIEIPARRADGHTFPLEISFGEYNQNGERFFIGIARDITKRKESERSLHESEERLRLATEAAEMFAWESDLQTGKIKWSDNACKVIGCSSDELSIEIEDGLFFVAAEDRERLNEEFEKTFYEGKTHYISEFRGNEPEGKQKSWLAQGLIIYDADGTPLKTVGVTQNITERKRAERMLVERERLAALNSDISLAIIQSNSLPEILQACAETIVEHLDAAFARIWTLGEKEQVLNLRASAGIYTHLDGAHSRVPVGKFKIGLIAEERKPHLTNSVVGDSRVSDQEWAEREGMISFAGYPLVVGERLVGVVAMFARRTLGLDAVKALESAANIIALGIERKRAADEREKLLQSEQSARREVTNILERIADGFIAVDREWHFTYINRAGAVMAGFSPEEMIGKTIWEVYPDTIGTKYETEYKRALYENVPVKFEEYLGSIDLWLEVNAYPSETGLSVFFSDITERKRAERALRESEEKFRIMANSISQFAWMADAEGSIFWYNRRWFEYTGTTLEEMQGWGWQTVHHPDYVERVTNKFKRYVEAGEPWEDTFPLRSKTGEYGWFLSRALPIRDEQGKIVRWFGTNTDITERKEAEAERERLLVSEQQSREIAEQANHAKDEFIAVVSHELRSPLNAMLGWTRILQKQKTDEKTTEYALDVIVRNARAQSKLIEDLLDIARVGEKKLRLEVQPTELAPIINAAVEVIKPSAEAKRIVISQSLDRAANFISGDDDRLRQVIENLLSNAVKFTPDGGRIDVRLEREGGSAKIIISDNGQGISREFLPQIFERFKQADLSTTRRHGGLGIGLSLAQDLVELHGGTISAESAGEGEGATFIVRLPLRTVAPIKENSGRLEFMDSQGKLSGFWILAVDDEADAREIVSFMLQINGAKVTTANSAVEALDILKNADGRLPDILLSDISMPNESGYALLEKIRALPEKNGGQIPAVALTAFNRPEDRQSAFEAGFQKHLGKPIEMDDLISAIIETAGKQ